MKKMILSLVAIAFVSGAAFAQDVQVAPPADQAVQVEQAQPTKQQVSEADLPEGVKNTLAADQYKEFQLQSAWRITEGQNEYYVLEIAKGDEKATLKLNKDGQSI